MKPKYAFDPLAVKDAILPFLRHIVALDGPLDHDQFSLLAHRYPRPDGGLFSRSQLIEAYRTFAGQDLPPLDEAVLRQLRRKPMRTMSGVTPVTVLTKPFPCPGECIFCPNDVRMPKSYLSDEPGAQRAEQNAFDPYLQTYSRLQTYHNLAHPTDKIEVIILGGTWSFYPETYQLWFVRRIFDALHDFGRGIDRQAEVWEALRAESQLHPQNNQANVTIVGLDKTYNQVVQQVYANEMRRSRQVSARVAQGLRRPTDEYATWEEVEEAHRINESAACRVVGLVIETRPDHISAEEVLRLRRLGCTKVQIGFQSLNDEVLRKNRRGHDVAATRRAVRLLRRVGFKIHAHWMPNLYGSSPEQDVEDYARMFSDPDFCPDELKVYPCSLIESAELMQRYQDGSWRPYTHDELLFVLVEALKRTPEYCRLTRIIRDIPSTDIVVGNQLTNFRQIAEDALRARGGQSGDIRLREVRHQTIDPAALHLDEVRYDGGVSDEIFLQFINAQRQIAAFLRLSLPKAGQPALHPDLEDAAIIREVHVYGQSLGIGQEAQGQAQHSGLGTRLIERAAELARAAGYERLAVISAVGTRGYYRKRGFADGALYQIRALRTQGE
ncbi:MAG: tRNA uridine(34) 5-carboxymethylaminomethyl modification radical SAM/GNAT enzyme Elp3 [Anaerolineae bacterium]|nr:tRNA uridine(34) 5-carboxymethylaminomethyl modification radical SAM/GNAT enzyme Elp3 [Anaerolineae bacterium]MDW8171890.1 tRNA uridine(34) 5-carboxymethylaminomethyl modification radical SAM/GNAT enzyme Elp3 [Anaerolineae bacterium]